MTYFSYVLKWSHCNKIFMPGIFESRVYICFNRIHFLFALQVCFFAVNAYIKALYRNNMTIIIGSKVVFFSNLFAVLL